MPRLWQVLWELRSPLLDHPWAAAEDPDDKDPIDMHDVLVRVAAQLNSMEKYLE